MRIAVFGGSGRTGRLLCERAVARGHAVAAYVRSPEKLAGADPAITVFSGTLDDALALRACLAGCDVAVSALGTVERRANTVLSDGTRAILGAMRAEHVGHFAAITSLGCGDSFAQVNSRVFRLVIRTLAKQIWADKDRQEEAIRQSGADFLIVRPGGLSAGPARGVWTELRSGERAKGKQMIPREDVADYILARIEALPLGDDTVTLV